MPESDALDPLRLIGELQAKCDILEAQVAALSAFACATLDSNPRRDELQTRWAIHLAPAIKNFSQYNDQRILWASMVPGWIDQRLSEKTRTS